MANRRVERRNKAAEAKGFVGARMRFSSGESLTKIKGEIRNPGLRKVEHATAWQNRRPICPYGCGEEGELVEVVMKDGKALGIYKDSEQLVFTADLQMAPKPTGRKIVIGPDGEPHLEEDV